MLALTWLHTPPRPNVPADPNQGRAAIGLLTAMYLPIGSGPHSPTLADYPRVIVLSTSATERLFGKLNCEILLGEGPIQRCRIGSTNMVGDHAQEQLTLAILWTIENSRDKSNVNLRF